ncbi:MAG: diguanylate cyclase [Ramlibacter sp.]|nr:diguanylate cyclase [Ramlibacter sp.]
MTTELPADPDLLVALGACAGSQVLVVCLCVFIANAYRERALLLHGASTITGVLAVQMLVGGHAFLAQAAMLAVLAIDAMQLLEVVSHAGALRAPRRWLVGISLGVLPLLAVVTALAQWHLLLVGLGAWAGVAGVIMFRAWPQSQPWVRWLLVGQAALALGSGWLGWRSLDAEPDPALPLAALLTVWSSLVFIATAWRGRIFSETRVRIDARNTTDPLTGLPMPMIFYDRVRSVRNLITRYGHPSAVMLVHIENLPRLAAEFGPEVAESAVLVAANRIRQALRDGDIAARLSHSRIGVLAEGMSLAEGSANIASRILVAGLKEPLPTAPTEFLHFRVVLTSVPVNDMAPKALLQRLATVMDDHLKTTDERRILAIPSEELLA